MARKLENEIIWKIGVFTRALKKERDRLFKPLDLSPADFSVLAFLYPDKALTVPQIARRLKVSRQHIQSAINRLQKRLLVIAKNNPDHARSPLYCLTGEGRLRHQAIRDRENQIYEKIFEGIPGSEKIICDRVLRRIIERSRSFGPGN